jgi:hypothetical protein
MISWLIVFAASIVAIVLAAASEAPDLLMAAAGLTSLIFLLLALRERRALAAASRSRRGAATARHVGLVWIWGGLGLLLTYALVLAWPEWWHFCLAFLAVGTLCLVYAAQLERDAGAGREDEAMLKLGRYLAIGQLVGMVVTVVGLAIDPDKEFLWIREGDWAGNIIFLFGAIALAAITAHALLTDTKTG